MERFEKSEVSAVVNSAEVTDDNFQRIIAAIIQKNGCTYQGAVELLQSLKLNVICGDRIAHSPSLQAALLTIVNTGPRAFWGGVNVSLPKGARSLLPLYPGRDLDAIVTDFGAKLQPPTILAPTLYLGIKPEQVDDAFEIACNGWQGGVLIPGDSFGFATNNDFALCGITAGSLAVGLSFLKASGIYLPAMDKSVGLSLWRPDLHWLDNKAEGPFIKRFPKRLWLLGLGHLGQAYAWNIGLMPINNPSEVTLLIQDYDKIVEANIGSGLLSTLHFVGKTKTRVCASWLEEVGFNTIITERAYNKKTIREGEEPFVALCGFDNASSRTNLDKSGFDLVVESGLGGSLVDFDQVSMHVFPNQFNTPESIWNNQNGTTMLNEKVKAAFDHKEDCGQIRLAEKAISTSFVGAFAGSMVIGELFRGLHKGRKLVNMKVSMRNFNVTAVLEQSYSLEHARNGSVACGNISKDATTPDYVDEAVTQERNLSKAG